ncbi:MAG: hypothetical protein ACP5NA_00020 [Candidatus Acidulodesulfobacterium sp.]
MKNRKKSLKFQIISKTFVYGVVIALISSLSINIIFPKINCIAGIFIGFAISFFLFTDTTLYIFRNIKKIKPFKLNLNLIKDLLIITIFFIILNKFINLNFVLIAAGITVTPVSVALLFIPFRHSLNYMAEE